MEYFSWFCRPFSIPSRAVTGVAVWQCHSGRRLPENEMHLARGRSEEAQPRAGLRFWRKRGFFCLGNLWRVDMFPRRSPKGRYWSNGSLPSPPPSFERQGLSSFGVSMIFDDMDRPWRWRRWLPVYLFSPAPPLPSLSLKVIQLVHIFRGRKTRHSSRVHITALTVSLRRGAIWIETPTIRIAFMGQALAGQGLAG